MKAAAIAALALIALISAAVACAPATPTHITIIRVTPETRSTPPPRAALANPELASCLNFRTVQDDNCENCGHRLRKLRVDEARSQCRHLRAEPSREPSCRQNQAMAYRQVHPQTGRYMAAHYAQDACAGNSR